MNLKKLFTILNPTSDLECSIALMMLLGIIRTAIQNEVSTNAGELASLKEWNKLYGKATRTNITNWLNNDIKGIGDIEFDHSFLINYFNTKEFEDEMDFGEEKVDENAE